MSQVSENTENNGIPALSAGNTTDTLNSTDRDVAADLNVIAAEEVAAQVAPVPNTETTSETVSAEEFLDEENTFDVSRKEFTELLDAFLRLYNGVLAYNKTAPHKILGIS